MKRFINFARSHYLLILLVLYGVFLIFYKWSGSFMGDEAVYSQVARESLASRSFFVLHWQGQLWFEKPPLVIWLTMLAFKLFGIAEISAHIFPGIFGICSAIVLYFTGKELFQTKWAGFFAGFVFMTTPIVFLYNRADMMDIPAGMFIALGFLASWKIFSGNQKWWLVFWAALGLGVMTKSVIGLFPLFLLPCLGLIYQKKLQLKEKFFNRGLSLFLFIVIPWHFYMTIRFGSAFWQNYFGYHVWQRFNSEIFAYVGKDNTAWGYLEVFINRGGIWSGFFLFCLVYFLTVILLRKRIRDNEGDSVATWINWHKKELALLAAWFLLMTLPFFAAQTKIPTYMLLAFFPLAIFVGGFLAQFFQKNVKVALYAVSVFSLLNFSPPMRLNALTFGEAQLLLPKIADHFFGFVDKGMALAMLLGFGIITGLFFTAQKWPGLFKYSALCLILGANILIPLNPSRNEFIKQLGQDITAFSDGQPIKLHFMIEPDQYPWPNVSAFYLPLGSSTDTIGQNRAMMTDANDKYPAEMCFVGKDFLDDAILHRTILSYEEGAVSGCNLDN